MYRSKTNGFSLVELMIALVINSFLLIAVIQLFSQSKGQYLAQEASMTMQENGRFAMDYITTDIRFSDYWGCAPDPSQFNVITAGPDANQFLNGGVFTSGILGQEGTGYISADAAFPVASDQITFIRAGAASGQLVRGMVDDTDVVVVGFDPGEVGDEITISDCERADIFTISNVVAADTDSDGIDDQWTISHDPTDIYGAVANNSNKLSHDYQLAAAVHSGSSSVTYLVAPDPANNNIPTLMRNFDAFGTPIPLIAGIETMQIVYGVDDDGDGNVDAYVDATNVADFNNVISIQFSFLARSEEQRNVVNAAIAYEFPGITDMDLSTTNDQITPTDRRSRRVFTATSTARNRAITASIR